MLTYPTTLYVIVAYCPSAKHLILEASSTFPHSSLFSLFGFLGQMLNLHRAVSLQGWICPLVLSNTANIRLSLGISFTEVCKTQNTRPCRKNHTSQLSTAQCCLINNQEAQRLATSQQSVLAHDPAGPRWLSQRLLGLAGRGSRP